MDKTLTRSRDNKKTYRLYTLYRLSRDLGLTLWAVYAITRIWHAYPHDYSRPFFSRWRQFLSDEKVFLDSLVPFTAASVFSPAASAREIPSPARRQEKTIDTAASLMDHSFPISSSRLHGFHENKNCLILFGFLPVTLLLDLLLEKLVFKKVRTLAPFFRKSLLAHHALELSYSSGMDV